MSTDPASGLVLDSTQPDSPCSITGVGMALTAREVEVLRLVAQGLSNKDIAARLVISPKTTGNHIEHIYTKIGASNRATASLFAMQHGLLPEEGFVPGP